MSRSHEEMVNCPNCGTQQSFTVWDSINVSVDPNLKEPLLTGKLSTFCCSHCGCESNFIHDTLYHDMDKSLAIWLNVEDDPESEKAKQMFSSASETKICRIVRTLHELYDKILIFDDDFNDFEIELYKFSVCLIKQLDLTQPFHYIGCKSSFLGGKSLVFIFINRDKTETIKCSMKDYLATTQPLVEKIRPLIDEYELTWSHLNRSYILNILEDAGLMHETTQDTPNDQTVEYADNLAVMEEEAVQKALSIPKVKDFLETASVSEDDLRGLRSRFSALGTNKNKANKALQNTEILQWYFGLSEEDRKTSDTAIRLNNWAEK